MKTHTQVSIILNDLFDSGHHTVNMMDKDVCGL